jgi:hypothetical protein
MVFGVLVPIEPLFRGIPVNGIMLSSILAEPSSEDSTAFRSLETISLLVQPEELTLFQVLQVAAQRIGKILSHLVKMTLAPCSWVPEVVHYPYQHSEANHQLEQNLNQGQPPTDQLHQQVLPFQQKGPC